MKMSEEPAFSSLFSSVRSRRAGRSRAGRLRWQDGDSAALNTKPAYLGSDQRGHVRRQQQ